MQLKKKGIYRIPFFLCRYDWVTGFKRQSAPSDRQKGKRKKGKRQKAKGNKEQSKAGFRMLRDRIKKAKRTERQAKRKKEKRQKAIRKRKGKEC